MNTPTTVEATRKNTHEILIPSGKLAFDPTKLAADLKAGRPVQMGKSGDVTGKEKPEMTIQPGKLAFDPTKLAADLKAGRPVQMGKSGDVTGKEKPEMTIQPGKLAAQWWERDPDFFKEEVEAMNHFFPQFELAQIKDPNSKWNNCVYWRGTLKPGILDGIVWDVMAIYYPNHPEAQMGGSVAVYLINPSIDNIKEVLGCRPHHLISDGEGGEYLCTTRREDMSNGRYVTTAAQTLSWATKWLTAFELVCTGHLTVSDFNNPVGI